MLTGLWDALSHLAAAFDNDLGTATATASRLPDRQMPNSTVAFGSKHEHMLLTLVSEAKPGEATQARRRPVTAAEPGIVGGEGR
jgi:hypothetical protein